jgi:hypothetical protein
MIRTNTGAHIINTISGQMNQIIKFGLAALAAGAFIMPVQVRIPTPLRKLTQNQEIVQIEGATIRVVGS